MSSGAYDRSCSAKPFVGGAGSFTAVCWPVRTVCSISLRCKRERSQTGVLDPSRNSVVGS